MISSLLFCTKKPFPKSGLVFQESCGSPSSEWVFPFRVELNRQDRQEHWRELITIIHLCILMLSFMALWIAFFETKICNIFLIYCPNKHSECLSKAVLASTHSLCLLKTTGIMYRPASPIFPYTKLGFRMCWLNQNQNSLLVTHQLTLIHQGVQGRVNVMSIRLNLLQALWWILPILQERGHYLSLAIAQRWSVNMVGVN